MSRHLLVSPHGRVQGRWHEAFDGLRVAADVAEASRLAKAGDIVWIDLLIPNAVAALRGQRPDLSVVALSLNPQGDEGVTAFEAGARGYCHLLAVPELLRQVAVVVANGGLWVGPELMSRVLLAVTRNTAPSDVGMAPAKALDSLTHRERDVARQVVAGASNKEIAQRLDITPRTVKAHMGAMFDKLGVRDRLQLVIALRNVFPDA